MAMKKVNCILSVVCCVSLVSMATVMFVLYAQLLGEYQQLQHQYAKFSNPLNQTHVNTMIDELKIELTNLKTNQKDQLNQTHDNTMIDELKTELTNLKTNQKDELDQSNKMMADLKTELTSLNATSSDAISQLQQQDNRFSNGLKQSKIELANLILTANHKFLLCGVGMQEHVTLPGTNKNIQDNQITASSYFIEKGAPGYEPYHGRLFGTSGQGCWAAKTNNKNQWIQVDLLKDIKVYGVVTQGRQNKRLQWVTSYIVEYKPSSRSYFTAVLASDGRNNIFQGNRDINTPVANDFPRGPVTARIFRIKPQTWYSWTSMRFDFYTC